MPTIDQLPASVQVTAADEVPLSQGGTTRNASIGAILAGTQPAISIASGSLLGRISLGPGGPEAVTTGAGLALAGGTLAATGADHAGFAQQPTLTPTDAVVLNSNGLPRQMPVNQLRGLFTAGTNVTIDSSGVIAAAAPAGPAGPTGPAWSPPKRLVTGPADSPTLADDQGVIGYSSAVPVAVTVADLGSLRAYQARQFGAGAVTLQPASGVTLVASGKAVASVAGAFPGAALWVTCTGTGTVYVTGNMQ
jgi:hypothetical protein